MNTQAPTIDRSLLALVPELGIGYSASAMISLRRFKIVVDALEQATPSTPRARRGVLHLCNRTERAVHLACEHAILHGKSRRECQLTDLYRRLLALRGA